VIRYTQLLRCCCYSAGLLGIELLIEYYQQEQNTKELPCRLERPCSGGLPPPLLSLSRGYTNVLHNAISTGISELRLLFICLL